MPIYTIHDTATQLSTTYSQSYQIRNSGNETIFLGKDTSVSHTYYDWSLSPGDTLGFGAETYLYVICAPGRESTLEQQYGALGNFTPGPSRVSIKTVSTILTQFDSVIPTGVLTQIYESGLGELDNYQTLIISRDAIGLGMTTSATNIYIEWLDASGNKIGNDNPIIWTYGAIEYQIPIRSEIVKISLYPTGLNNWPGGALNVLATSAVLPRRYWQSPSLLGAIVNFNTANVNDMSYAGAYGFDFSPLVAGTGFAFIPAIAGNARALLNFPTANSTNYTFYTPTRNSALSAIGEIRSGANSVAGFREAFNWILPEAPLVLTIGTLTTSRIVGYLQYEVK